MFYCGNCILHPVLGYLPDLQEKRTGGIFPGRNSAVLHSYPDSSAFYVTDKKQPEPALSVNGMDDFRTPVFLYQPQTDSVCTEKGACVLSVSAGNFLLYSFRQSESHVPDHVCTDGALHGGQTASEKEHRKGGFLPEYLYGGAGLFLWNIATQIFCSTAGMWEMWKISRWHIFFQYVLWEWRL